MVEFLAQIKLIVLAQGVGWKKIQQCKILDSFLFLEI